MLRIMGRTWGLTLLVGALGALLGYGIELVAGQAGWALVGASIGLCGGAVYAGWLATRDAAAPAAPAATTTEAAPAAPAE